MTAALAIAGVAVAIRPQGSSGGTAVRFSQAQAIVAERCVPCHSAHPTKVAVAPAGLVFDTPREIASQARLIQQVAVRTKAMPLGNVTGMTQAERDTLGAWIDQGAKTR